LGRYLAGLALLRSNSYVMISIPPYERAFA
jgi:hypothetical protein